jgi:hypothetical protein
MIASTDGFADAWGADKSDDREVENNRELDGFNLLVESCSCLLEAAVAGGCAGEVDRTGGTLTLSASI